MVKVNLVDLKKMSFILESKPYLPMTKKTLFETLKQLYEMQGQYQFQIKLIQEEDLLDELPVDPIRRSKLLQRIASEKQSNAALKKRETYLAYKKYPTLALIKVLWHLKVELQRDSKIKGDIHYRFFSLDAIIKV